MVSGLPVHRAQVCGRHLLPADPRLLGLRGVRQVPVPAVVSDAGQQCRHVYPCSVDTCTPHYCEIDDSRSGTAPSCVSHT